MGAPLLHKPSQAWGAPTPEDREKELKHLAAHGISASQLATQVRALGGDWRWIKRISGNALPSPSVVHLQFDGETGHYSALLEEKADFTRLIDAYLRLDGFLENATLNRQASGYFLVPGNNPLPEGFVAASADELDSVFGRTSCPFGNEDEGCNEPKEKGCGGMAVASISRFLPGLIVRDEPLTYQPLYGPGLDLRLEYRQVQLHNEDSSISAETSHLGPLWSHGFLSYIKASDGSPLPGSSPLRVFSGGSYIQYTFNGGGYVSRYAERPALTPLATGYRLTSSDGSYQEFTQANAPTPTRFYLTTIRDAQGHTLTLAYDGALRLSTITDATNKVTAFGYGPDIEIEGQNPVRDLKIRSITDHFARTASFAYDEQGRLKSITDAIGITSSFTYDDEKQPPRPERIATVTTPYGITQVTYENNASLNVYDRNWAVTLTNPEGFSSRVEHFYHDALTPFSEPRPPTSIQVGSAAVTFLTTVQGDPVDPEVGDHFHVTLEWDMKQWYHYQADKAANPGANPPVNPKNYAEYTLWLMRSGNTPSSPYSTNVPLATRKPGESAVWYNYEGQTVGYLTGTSALPIKIARQVENENGVPTWVMTQQTYNALGLPLVSTDERGRQTRTNYLANNQDPSTVQALTTAPSTWTTLSTYTYPTPNLHLPATVTDISGLTNTYSYNAKNQITQVKTSKGASVETTRRTYSATGTGTPPAWPGTPGFLVKVGRTDPANAAAWVTTDESTYDAVGRVRTRKDASGYERIYDYDDFDRLTLVTHPDGSTEQFAYSRLDLAATKDRAGRWTRTLYNSRRQPVVEIAPDGDITQLEWCLCGKLQKLIDPLGHTTKWTWTIGGRNTEKLLPDGVTKTTYGYYARSGRLSTMKQPNDQGGGSPTMIYRYYVDGRLQKEDYTDAGTPDVTYYYTTTKTGTTPDPLGRLTFVDDGIGTHTLSYKPLTASTTGAGRLEYSNGPLTNDRIQNVHDWQNRVGTANLIYETLATNLRAESFTWDTLGRSKTIVNTLGTYTYGYATNLPRPDSLTGPNTLTSSFTYKPNNAPGDSARRLASITHLRGAVQQAQHIYGYDKAGRITSWEQQSIGQPGAKTAYAYNLNNELVQAEDTDLSTNTLLDRESWGLDAAGNWLSHARSATSHMETRTIDVLNRLMQTGGAGSTVVEGRVNEFAAVTVNGQPAELRTDPATGAYRFRRTVPVAEGSNTVAITATDPQGEVTPVQNWQFNVPALSRTFTYDNNGNTLSDGQRTMTWDAKNRLKTVTKNGTTWKWDYDYRDRRVREYTNDVVTRLFIWSNKELVQERTAGNAITRTYYTGGFSDGAAPTAGTKYQTLTDHLGNVREVLTTTGSIAARYDYTPYQGPVKIGASTVDPTFLTAGRYYHHAGSGLHLALYRTYDPVLGRWLSRDPLKTAELLPEGPNLYAYVGNLPTQLVDPFGHSAGLLTLAGTCALADGPLPIGDIVAGGILIYLGCKYLAQGGEKCWLAHRSDGGDHGITKCTYECDSGRTYFKFAMLGTSCPDP